MTTPRTKTGVTGLDAMLNGGFLPGSVILVRGAPGTGKTSLALQFLVEGARLDEPGLFITFEEFPHSLYRDAATLGFDLKTLETAGKLHIIFTSPAVLAASLKDPQSPICKILVEHDIQRAAIDSMTHFQRISEDFNELRKIFTAVTYGLRREKVTTLLLSEEERSQYQRTDRGGLAYLSDGIILLRYVEIESDFHKALVVLKLRGSHHEKAIRHYDIKEGGLVMGQIFQHRGAILSGISRRD